MRKKLFLSFAFFFVVAKVLYAEVSLVSGSSGLDFSFPFGKNQFVPDVQFKIGMPFELYPACNLELDKMDIGLKLQWKSRLSIFAGTLVHSGTVSLLKNPDFSLTLSPLGVFSFSGTGIQTSLPSFSDSKSPYSVAMSLLIGKTAEKNALIQAAVSQEDFYSVGFVVPFSKNNLNFTLITLGGFYRLPPELPDKTDSWFVKDVPYGGGYNFGLVQELRFSNKKIKIQGNLGMFSSPFGGIDFWTRFAGNYTLGCFDIKGGFYLGDYDIITANGSRISNVFQSYINPQFNLPLGNSKYNKLRLGLAFATEGRNTSGKEPVFLVEGKLKGGMEFYSPRFVTQLIGGWQGFSIYGSPIDSVSKAEEKFVSELDFSLKNLFWNANFGTGFKSTIYSSKDRKEFGIKTSITPVATKNKGWRQLIPSVSAATDFVFREKEFYSVATKINASWTIREGFITAKASLTVEFDNKAK